MIQIHKNAKLLEIATAHPEIVEIMAELGFDEIKIPGMLKMAGRMVDIPTGAKMKHIDWDRVVTAFAEHGYEFVD